MNFIRTKRDSSFVGAVGNFTMIGVLVENILPDVDESLRWGARSVVVLHHHLLLDAGLMPLLLQLHQLSLDILVLLAVGRQGAGQALETHLLQDVVDLAVFAAQVGHHLRLGLGGETANKALLAGLSDEVGELGLYVADKVVGAVLVELAEGGAGCFTHLALQLVVHLVIL